MPNSQVSFSFDVDPSKLQEDRQKYIVRVDKIKKKIESKLARLQEDTREEAPQTIRTLQDLETGLEKARICTLTALDGLESYAKSGQTTITANLDDDRNCTGYLDQNIQQFFTNVIEAINTLRDCRAFTMSAKLVQMEGMALWSQLHQYKATQLAEEMQLTTLEGSLGGSLFDQLPWGTRWQSIQGDPLHTQWKALSMIAANMAIKNKVANVFLFIDPNPISILVKEELPHLIAHGITIEPDKGLESIRVHRYGLAEDPRQRPIDIIFQNQLNLQNQNIGFDKYIISPSDDGLAKIYFHKRGEKPVLMHLPQSSTAMNQLRELTQLTHQTSNAQKNSLRIKLLAHGLISRVPGHHMFPKLIKTSEVIVRTNLPETVTISTSQDLPTKKQAFKDLVTQKLRLQVAIDESFEVVQNSNYILQKSRSTFERILKNMREKAENEVSQIYKGKEKPPILERAHLVSQTLTKTCQAIGQNTGGPIRFYDATVADRSRIIWQISPPKKIIQQKHFVLTTDPSDNSKVQAFYMEGEQLKSQVFDKAAIKDLTGLKLEDGKREVCYSAEKAKKLQVKLNVNPVKHEDLQLEGARAYEKYTLSI